MPGRPNAVQLFCKAYELRMIFTFFLNGCEKKYFVTQENYINSNFITHK